MSDKKHTAQSIYDELHRMICELKVMPGTRVTESQLADYFQVSRTPIRAALQLLENEGLLSIKPKQGCFINNLDMQKISEYYDVRVSLENMALSEIAKNEEFDELRDLAEQWNPSTLYFGTEINDEIKRAEESFHLDLASISKNSVLTNYIANINDKIRVVRILGWPDVSSVEDTYIEHYRVCELLLAKKLEEAKDELSKHIRKSQERAMSITLEQLYNNSKAVVFD